MYGERGNHKKTAEHPLFLRFLKYKVFRRAREWFHITDVLHAAEVHQHAVKAQTEAGMLASAEAAQIHIPLQ